MKQPSKHHQFGFSRDIAGNAGIVFKTRNHTDWIYGMFKGRETLRGDDTVEQWLKEGELLPLLGHPHKGDIVLKMGIPIQEITGAEAKAIIDRLKAEGVTEEEEKP